MCVECAPQTHAKYSLYKSTKAPCLRASRLALPLIARSPAFLDHARWPHLPSDPLHYPHHSPACGRGIKRHRARGLRGSSLHHSLTPGHLEAADVLEVVLHHLGPQRLVQVQQLLVLRAGHVPRGAERLDVYERLVQ
jgi:hypothetical protein